MLTRWDAAAGTIVVDGTTVPVPDAKIMDNVSVGERVIVTVLVEHYGRAARRLAIRVERTNL